MFPFFNIIYEQQDVFGQVSLYTNPELLTDEGIPVLSLQLREFL